MTPVESLMIGDSAPMQRLREMIARVAPARIPVLIEGATGTGKELVAALLHRWSKRDGAFVAFNVSAVGESMFEDALFGHTKGAFTGAARETLGFLREANGGTAFFDEISALPVSLQPKLLRALETGTVRPIGSSRDAISDFRVVAATNEGIDGLVEKGRFRLDLAHRLCGMAIKVPTLAERVDDIPDLIEHFVRRADPEGRVLVARSAIQVLQGREWPGNVRELKQVVEAALVFTTSVLDSEAITVVLAQRTPGTAAQRTDPAFIDRQRLMKLLKSADWDTGLAAVRLGVHRTTIYRRMRRLGIAVPSLAHQTMAICDADAEQRDTPMQEVPLERRVVDSLVTAPRY